MEQESRREVCIDCGHVDNSENFGLEEAICPKCGGECSARAFVELKESGMSVPAATEYVLNNLRIIKRCPTCLCTTESEIEEDEMGFCITCEWCGAEIGAHHDVEELIELYTKGSAFA